MKMIISDFGDLGKRVTLIGRLDISGSGEIHTPLQELADSKVNIIVDMKEVDFIGSLGMRSLGSRRRPSRVMPEPSFC